jgi:hypothetical protein
LLTALREFRLADSARTAEQLEPVLTEVSELKHQLPAPDRPVIEVMEKLVIGFAQLCHWVQASLAGDIHAGRFLNAAHSQAIIAAELLPSIRYPVFADSALKAVDLMKNADDFQALKDIALELQHIPVPVFQFVQEERSHQLILGDKGTEAPGPNRSEGPFVIKVMFEVDRKPWSTSQILHANTIYDLSAVVTIPEWPDDADFLLIDYIATMHPDHYKISELRIQCPGSRALREFNLQGHVEFPVPQSLVSEPIVILVRATFLSSSDPARRTPATIVGYHQLRVRVSDKARTPLLARYRSIDARNYEIVEEIHRSMPNLDPQHLHDFIEALGAVTNYLGVNLQQAIYKEGRVIHESDFQRDLLRHLRSLLGEDVREAPKQGGGETDIQYRSVTIELKVEDKISDRRKLIEKYLAQPTQYSSAGGAQLGILCILDLTEKHRPPANPQSQITLESPHLHGFGDNAPFPTKIAVVFIDGNLRLPSSYSR